MTNPTPLLGRKKGSRDGHATIWKFNSFRKAYLCHYNEEKYCLSQVLIQRGICVPDLLVFTEIETRNEFVTNMQSTDTMEVSTTAKRNERNQK